MGRLQWWGYLHVNGSLQVKRYFEPLDLEEARQSPFVKAVYGPWNVEHRSEALRRLEEEIKAGLEARYGKA